MCNLCTARLVLFSHIYAIHYTEKRIQFFLNGFNALQVRNYARINRRPIRIKPRSKRMKDDRVP
jgi:hypothetical protein